MIPDALRFIYFSVLKEGNKIAILNSSQIPLKYKVPSCQFLAFRIRHIQIVKLDDDMFIAVYNLKDRKTVDDLLSKVLI